MMPRLRLALFTGLLVAVLGLGTARGADVANFQDQWWNAAESGWGAAVLQQSDTLFVCFFVYGSDGKPTWFIAVATAQPAPPAGHTIFSGQLYATTGPYFGGPFTAAPVVERVAGTFTFDATSATAAVIRYVVDGVAVDKEVTRQTWTHVNLGAAYYGGTSGVQTQCGADNGTREGESFIDIVHAADDTITLTLTDPAKRPWIVTGTYTQSGHIGRITGTVADPIRGRSGTADLFEIEPAHGGITGRGRIVWQQSGATTCVWDGRWGGVRLPAGDTMVAGLVGDGTIADALVCLDRNRNGRCDAGEPQARSDATGAYLLAVPKDVAAPLVAEVIAGVSRDAQQPGTTVDVSYRMASPSAAYSANVTPISTVVHLTTQSSPALAEDFARNELGLPPRFELRPAMPPAAGSLSRSVANAVVTALKATSTTLDLSSPAALATLVAAFPPALTTLPTMTINTRGGAPILSTEIYVDATFTLTNPVVSATPVNLNGQIRGRGHSTWGQPKSPYHVKFADDASLAALPDVLGMRTTRHWALLADWFDRSLLRNKLALSLGSSAVFNDGLKWTSSGQHVEVFLNGDYVGVHLLTENIRIEPARVDVRVMDKDPAAGEVDGGYIVQVDIGLDCYNVGSINLQHLTPQGVKMCVDKPDEEDITLPQLNWIKGHVDEVETGIYGSLALDRINVASFVDWYLVNELYRNNDAAFATSVYLWKDSASAPNPVDRLLNFGPLWDFDLGAGNFRDNDNWKTDGCWIAKKIGGYVPNWFARLWDSPEFVAATLARWKQKRANLATFVNTGVDTYARRIAVAQQRNFARWPILGTQLPLGGYYQFATWNEEVAFLKQYLNDRMLWLDQAYATPMSFAVMCR